jgi:hypothetical protein
MNAFNAGTNLTPSSILGSSWNLNPPVIEGLRKNQAQIKRKNRKHYKNVKSLGGGTSVLNITRYKATGNNTMRKRIVLFLYYYRVRQKYLTILQHNCEWNC